MKPRDACLLCELPRQGWIHGTYAYPGHDCPLCAGHCEWPAYWERMRDRGVEERMWGQLLVTQALAKGARARRR